MKKLLILVLAVIMTAGMASIVFAIGSGAGIVNSPHDFSGETWNLREEICRVCHVPHDHANASQRYLNGLLWNHEVSSATYTMYDSTWSPTLDGTQSSQPDGTAKLCLGCHDGTIAIDTFDKYAGGTVNITDYDPGYEIPAFLDGTNEDLRGTHPISIDYASARAADPGGFSDPSTKAMGLSGVIDDVLDGGKVQCSSCHDVHDQESVAGTHLLRVAQKKGTGGCTTGSCLCLVCHIK